MIDCACVASSRGLVLALLDIALMALATVESAQVDLFTKCTRLNSSNATASLCHNATHGTLTLNFTDDWYRAMLLRVAGPHPQTKLFDRCSSRDPHSWEAQFRLCEPGEYTAHVLLLLRSPTEPTPGESLQTHISRHMPAACPIFHTKEGVLLQRHAFRLEEGMAVDRKVCADGLWRWQDRAPREFAPGHTEAARLRTAAAACRGSWRFGEGCEARNRSLARNLGDTHPRAPLSAQRAARESLSSITLTGTWGVGRHGGRVVKDLFSPPHPLRDALAATYAHLVWTTSHQRRHGGSASFGSGDSNSVAGGAGGGGGGGGGGSWRARLPPGGCACLLGDSMNRELSNRLVQRFSVACHQEEMHDSKGLCASGGALATMWVRAYRLVPHTGWHSAR